MPLRLSCCFTGNNPKNREISVASAAAASASAATECEIPPTALEDGESRCYEQHIIVMRHGDRIDHARPTWILEGVRPWDPPLADPGFARAFATGKRIREEARAPIHRVFVSPFLRCIQTASQVITALIAVEDITDKIKGEGITIDASKLKASIEYGLCELYDSSAMRIPPPKNGKWDLKLSELEDMLPAGTADNKVQRVSEKMPQWGESVMDARDRYKRTILSLANRYPTQNLLLITHAQALKTAVSTFLEGMSDVTEVECCAYVELRRTISCEKTSITAGKFEVLTASGTNGIAVLDFS